MEFNSNQVFKERYSKIIREAEDEQPVTDSLDPSTPPPAVDSTVEPTTEPSVESPLDTDAPNTPEVDFDNSQEEIPMLPDNSMQNVTMLDVLEKFSGWKDTMNDFLDYAIKGSELLNNDLEREGITYITKDQINKFATILESTREVFLTMNDISFDSEKLIEEIDLSKKILLTKKESARKEKAIKESRSNQSLTYEDIEHYIMHPGTYSYAQFFVNANGDVLSHQAVKSNMSSVMESMLHPGSDREWEIEATDINWEDCNLYCEYTNEVIECVYPPNNGRDIDGI